MIEPVSHVLAIKPSDDYLHVGASDLLLPHLGVTKEDPAPDAVADLEFYDAAGTRLEIGEDGGEPALVPHSSGETADPQLLVDRIAVVLARAQVHLDREPNPAIGARVPQLQAALPAVLAALAAEFGPLPPSGGVTPDHTGDAFHNWLHAIGAA